MRNRLKGDIEGCFDQREWDNKGGIFGRITEGSLEGRVRE